jgi:4-amino-4-deoxy-L-arabinose transferase-like glycosyltransferase
MAKPQYPFLFHALQITVNQGQRRWNDTAANAMLWLLSLGSFAAMFLILRRIADGRTALLTLTLILGIPLLSVHLGQGYADIALTQEILLSLACLLAWIRTKRDSWLLVSALLVASAVWTKSEGLFFGLIPWILAVAFVRHIDRVPLKQTVRAVALAIGLALPWQLFALLRGLLLTPHNGDTRFAFHPEGLPEALKGLFDRGSFGIAWYVLPVAVVWMLIEARRPSAKMRRSELAPLLWGLLVFVEILFIYLFTPNVQFLLNAESYYRQMMLPAAMLTLSCVVLLSNTVSYSKREVAGR